MTLGEFVDKLVHIALLIVINVRVKRNYQSFKVSIVFKFFDLLDYSKSVPLKIQVF